MDFGIINWGVLIAVVVGTTWAGHVLSGKGKGLEGFFRGGDGLPWWAVSASIMASQISAVTIIALPGAIFRDGGNLLFMQGTLIGFVIAKFLMVFLFVKPFYEKKIYSPYEFIEDRLGARASQLSRGLFLVSAILGHGIRLLTVALVLSVVVGIPIGQSVLVIGIFAVLWTIIGGVTTVIWTDFILFLVILGGAIFSLVFIFGELPFGLGEALAQLDAAAKLKLIDVSLDPARTWTLWTCVLCFTIFELAQNSVDHVITQRMLCCRNYKEARKAVLGSLGIVVFSSLMAAVGLGIWLFYQHVPLNAEQTAFLAEQPSRAYPFFVVHQLPVGISGLIVASIFAAGISTLDSALAALSETCVNGYYRKWINPAASEQRVLTVSRISVVAWGILLSVLAYLAGKLVQNEGLLNLAYKTPVVTYGPMLMIGILALLRRGSFAALGLASAAAVATSVVLLVLKARGVVGFDQFWIYPITCVVFALVVFAVSLICPDAAGDGGPIRSKRESPPGEGSSTADNLRGEQVARAKGLGA
ncbi:MAG: sodium/solute symporter [Verrucomicrobia bacterium]|jgi:SSS family transporter|nr:sodium/solute symporter [Verrucomicrobiota bacterium]